jgi:aldehyde dehydrogenase (NAD(P)+)
VRYTYRVPAAEASPRPTSRPELDLAVARLRDHARAWAEAPITARIALARSIQRGLTRVAGASVQAACRAKGIAPEGAAAGELWMAGPYVGLSFIRQLIESLESIAATGSTPEGRLRDGPGGRLTERLFPCGAMDRLVFLGMAGEVHYQEGVDRAAMREARAAFYRRPDHQGRVCLVLGAGNVDSIPLADVLAKLFNEGKVCALKLNPVNAYLGPLLQEAMAEAVDRGFVQVVQGGAEEGSYLTHHPAIDEVHITGSDRTHDALVWGPPGPERVARQARGEPVLHKGITSELGNVTPVMLVPGPWTEAELALQADNLAGMVTHNASFNCIAGKVLVLPRGWGARTRFLDLLMDRLARTPARRAWYPGAFDRYRALTEGRAGLRTVGGGEGTLPWTLLPDLDPGDPSEAAFRTEPFCAVLSETQLPGDDPEEFLEAAVAFANQRLWGTLAAALLVHPRTERAHGPALARAVQALRYGSVCLNVWPGVAYAAGTLPWGAFPGSPLLDIRSGRGLVHNTRMLGRVEKTLLRAPVSPLAKLPYLPSHRTANLLGRRLTALKARGGWTGLPGVLSAGLRG